MKIITTLFALGLVGCVFCQCPTSEAVMPCRLNSSAIYKEIFSSEILITCDNSTMSLEDLKTVLNNLYCAKNFTLYLVGLNLGKVPSNFFNGSSISNLFIINCTLESLSGDVHGPALVGLEECLEILEIENSFTQEDVTAKLNLAHLRNLYGLKWTYNRIPAMNNDWFDEVPATLGSLILSSNGIETLGDRVFSKFTNLGRLGISNEPIRHIERSMFPFPAEKLWFLVMEGLDVSGIPEDLFSNMTNLQIINLERMGISSFEQKTWGPVLNKTTSVVISISENPLVCDSDMKWLVNIDNLNEKLFGICRSPKIRNRVDVLAFVDIAKEFLREECM